MQFSSLSASRQLAHSNSGLLVVAAVPSLTCGCTQHGLGPCACDFLFGDGPYKVVPWVGVWFLGKCLSGP